MYVYEIEHLEVRQRGRAIVGVFPYAKFDSLVKTRFEEVPAL